MKIHLSYYQHLAEDMLGLAAIYFLGFLPPLFAFALVLVGLTANTDAPICMPIGFALLSVPFAVLAVWLVRMTSRAMNMCYPELQQWDNKLFPAFGKTWTLFTANKPIERTYQPMAIVLSSNVPRLSRWLAPFVSIYWFGHFATGLVVCLVVDFIVDTEFQYIEAPVRFLISQAIGFPFTFATNVYLLLAIAVWTANLNTLKNVWRRRVLIDLTVLLIPYAIYFAIQWR